jgi:hypothetical protein
MRRWRVFIPLVAVAALLVMAVPASSSDPPKLDPLGFGLTLLNTFPEPLVDPSDPPGFFRVKPQEFDPAHTDLVQAAWLNAIGCPTDAFIAIPDPTFTEVADTAPFTDEACATGDPRDQHNEGLLLVKTGPTANFASATAELHRVKGTVLTEFGWDIRKNGTIGGSGSPLGSHCGAGAPRWNILTTDNFYFVGCNSPPAPLQTSSTTGWIRMRWNAALLGITGTVVRIQIVFDEGQDVSGGPDQFGAAILDNISINGAMVGHGATEAD